MIVAIAFIVFLIIGMPIAFSLGATGVILAMVMGHTNLFTMLPQRMFAAADSASLMAIPLFILAGELMGIGGITAKLADMSRSFMGHIKGGMAYTTVVVGVFLGSILGSATAAAALIGRIMKPEMDKDKYDEEFTSCLTAATSILGPIIPPSMIFIVYGVTAQVSIGDMFFAGIVPGLLLGGAFMCLIYFTGKKKNVEWSVRKKTNWKNRFISIGKGAPALLIPVIILGGIIGGITTPTESAAAASFVALIIGLFVYKKLKIRDLAPIFRRTAITSSSIMIIISLANILGWTMAFAQIPQMIVGFLLSLSENPYVLLILINIFLLFVGMVLETFAAIIILVPVLLPVVTAVGIDPLHFGMIMCVNLTIGLMTPPVGVTLFTTASVTNVSINRLIKPIWKWVGVSLIVLLIITFIPDLVTFLPKTFLH